MNTVHITLNSYTQEVRLRINGKQPSPYSELSDFTFRQVLQSPDEVFRAVERELNDDFDLLVTGNAFEFAAIRSAAKFWEGCLSCKEVPAKMIVSSQKRAAILKDHLAPAILSFAVAPGTEPIEDIRYGNITAKFSTSGDADYDLKMGVLPKDVAIAAYETFVINPHIGKIVESASKTERSLFLLNRIDPFVKVEIPSTIEVGATVEATIQIVPRSAEAPVVVLESENPDILRCSGHTVTACNVGRTTIHCYIEGDSRPFESKTVGVSKTICAETLEFDGLNDCLPVGKPARIRVKAYPADAMDIDSLTYETSDPGIAEIKGNSIIPKAPGSCIITASGRKSSCQKKITVAPKLERIILSPSELTLNIGQKAPINITCLPEDAYNGSFGWSVGDDTVAEIVYEDGVHYIKAIGIGETSIFCISKDLTVDAECKVAVRSMMYSKQKGKPWVVPLVLALALAIFLFIPFGSSKKKNRQVDEKPINYSTKYKDATPIDIFEEIEIVLGGVNGSGSITIINESRNPFVMGCYFNASKTTGISNGDEIIISARFNEENIELYGYAPISVTKTIVINELMARIENHKQLTPEFIAAAKEYSVGRIKEKTEELRNVNSKTSYSEPKFESAYFQTDDFDTQFVLIYSYETYMDGVSKGITYMPIYYTNLEVNEKGEIGTDVSDCIFTLVNAYMDYDALLDYLYGKYGYTTVQVE